MQVERCTNKYLSINGLEAWPGSKKKSRILALPDLPVHSQLASCVPTQAGKAEEAWLEPRTDNCATTYKHICSLPA